MNDETKREEPVEALTDKERLALRLTDHTLARDEAGRRIVAERVLSVQAALLNELRRLREQGDKVANASAERSTTLGRNASEEPSPRGRDVAKSLGLNGLVERLGEMRRYKRGLLPEGPRTRIEAELANPLSESSVISNLEEACGTATQRVRGAAEWILEAALDESLRREVSRREEQDRRIQANRERDNERDNEA